MAIGDDHDLLPAQSLGLFFDPGVQVADHGLEPAHLLAIEVDDETEHAVGGRVMGAEIYRQQLAAEGARLAGLGDGDALADLAAHAFSGAVRHASCSSENSTTSPPTG